MLILIWNKPKGLIREKHNKNDITGDKCLSAIPEYIKRKRIRHCGRITLRAIYASGLRT